jgi:hypothetical protein
LARSAAIVLALWVCAVGPAHAQMRTGQSVPEPTAASIWFHPLPAAVFWGNGPGPTGGSTDFLSLFETDAPWQTAIPHVSVFGMYAGWILATSDADLQQTVAFLNAHNMSIEIEAPALQATPTCGSGVEGYVPYPLAIKDVTLTYLQQLKLLGADVAFVKVDEPFFYGNVVNEPGSCHFTVSKIASEVGEYTKIVKSVYPKVAVGDVEPIIASAYTPDVGTAIQRWHDTYRKVTGARFPFFFADIDFSNPQWPTIVESLEAATHKSSMRFGIIYIGDYQDTSDAEWAGKARARFETYQVQDGNHPDYVLLQSWDPYPTFCLPETDPTTFTGVLDAYISATATTPRPQ